MKNMETTGEKTDMSRAKRALWAVIGAITLAGCGSAQADPTDEGVAAESTFVRMINVEVQTLEAEPFVEEIRLTSVAMANQDVLVAAEESGVVRELFVDRGDRVAAGDAIAKIDDGILTAQVAQARAAAELAQQTWERRKRLWEEDQVGSELAYLEARYMAEQASATLSALEQRLERTVVRAPFDGVLEDRRVDIGATVNPGDAIGRLVDLNPIRVFAGVPERYATDVKVGAPAQLTFEALDGQAFEATIRYVGATVNPANRTFPIEVVLPNPGRRIKPEMVANMSVTRRQVSAALVVPQDALVRVEDGYVAYVVAERGGVQVAEVRPVQLGPARRNLVVVESGLAVGDRLVIVGQKSIADGDRVNVVGERE